MLNEFELKQRHNDYLREVRRAVRQEQLYQQVKANRSNLSQRIVVNYKEDPMDPNLFKLAEMRHAERLREAETARRFNKVARPGAGWSGRLLDSLGNFLIALGQKLKTESQPRMAKGVVPYDHHTI